MSGGLTSSSVLGPGRDVSVPSPRTCPDSDFAAKDFSSATRAGGVLRDGLRDGRDADGEKGVGVAVLQPRNFSKFSRHLVSKISTS